MGPYVCKPTYNWFNKLTENLWEGADPYLSFLICVGVRWCVRIGIATTSHYTWLGSCNIAPECSSDQFPTTWVQWHGTLSCWKDYYWLTWSSWIFSNDYETLQCRGCRSMSCFDGPEDRSHAIWNSLGNTTLLHGASLLKRNSLSHESLAVTEHQFETARTMIHRTMSHVASHPLNF